MIDPPRNMPSIPEKKKHWTDGSSESAREVPRQERIVVLLMSGIILGVVFIGLWVTLGAAAENVRQSRALQQIIEIVYATRQISTEDQSFESKGHDDLLKVLEDRSFIKTNAEIQGIRVMANPWGNAVVAVSTPGGKIRLESIVPPHACQRIIEFFGKNSASLLVDSIEVKGWNNSWRQVFNKSNGGKISNKQINAGCNDTVSADVALVFEIR